MSTAPFPLSPVAGDDEEVEALKPSVDRALKLLYLCDQRLRDADHLAVIRFDVHRVTDPEAFYLAQAEAEEKMRENRLFKQAITIVKGRPVVPLSRVPLIALPGKKWDATRSELWPKFVKERLRDRETWCIDERDNIQAHAAATIVLEFQEYTSLQRKASALKNRRRAAKNAQAKNPKNRKKKKPFGD
ncbi:MAG: hypothetical protein JNJ83_23335 [Verrucomicrobiaceae bacterium]|nr:hypothetical protein [Verrucomicrobiaceae bacterium]